jgi:uncharacterized membrane protein
VWRWAFLASAIGWAAALPIAAWLTARPSAPVSAFALAVYALGGVVCHQLPERSFHLWSVQMPVCARCTGIYVGGAIAAVASIVTVRLTGPSRVEGQPRAKSTLLLSALPTVATLVFEWTTGQAPANPIRAVAGFPIGAAVVWVILSAIRGPAPPRERK